MFQLANITPPTFVSTPAAANILGYLDKSQKREKHSQYQYHKENKLGDNEHLFFANGSSWNTVSTNFPAQQLHCRWHFHRPNKRPVTAKHEGSVTLCLPPNF